MAEPREPKEPKAKPDAEAEARAAELARQDEQREAVDQANRDELPKIGGPLKNPGLGL